MVGTVPHTHPKPFPATKQKQEIAKSVLGCYRLVFVLTVEIFTQGDYYYLFYMDGWTQSQGHQVQQGYPGISGGGWSKEL